MNTKTTPMLAFTVELTLSRPLRSFFPVTRMPRPKCIRRRCGSCPVIRQLREGTVAVRRGPTQPTKAANYSALFVRDDGQWRLAQLREISPSDNATIDDLSWLIGEWKSATGEGAEIRTTYTWDDNKKFINVQFTLKEQTLNLSGRQIIGVDPATGGIRSWTFEANGGVAEADWRRDGDHWVLDSDGTLPDGRTLTQTNVLRRINDDTVTWQSVDRVLGDEEIPDLAPVKVTRIKPE